MKKVITILVVLVLAVVVYFLVRGGDEATSTPTPSASASMTATPSSSVSVSPSASASVSPTVSRTPTPGPTTVNVSYTASGYSPNTITFRKGSTIVFKNNSSKDMWPASANHPTHSVYPGEDTCFSGKFEGCNIAPGGTFTMQFNHVGTWQYHDHLDSSKTGTVIVTP